MARFGLTLEGIAGRTGLDERTIKGILSGANKPRAGTLHKLADGLGVSADEFFQDPSLLAYRQFDRETNPVIDQVIAEQPALFEGWAEGDFAELYSRFGTGGALTGEGTLAMVRRMNQHRGVHRKVALLLESDQAGLLTGLVDLLFDRVVMNQ